MSAEILKKFINSLKRSPERIDVFNPWWQNDEDNDITEIAPYIRKQQLFHYLKERISTAKYILVGEAIGYQGGHFSGIPMTSERILLGGMKVKGILPEHVFTGISPKRTSRLKLKREGFSEPTATIVWGHIIDLGKDPYEFILWNAYPWHPYDPEKGKLSNRTPDKDEFQEGLGILKILLDISKINNVIALGKKSSEMLLQLGIKALEIRHPAQGGARVFRKQLGKYLKIDKIKSKKKIVRLN